MRARTVRDLGALVRSSRRAQGLTQADLASRLGVSRDWVVRFESGRPRVEAQKVLGVLGLVMNVEQNGYPMLAAEQPVDPFAFLLKKRQHRATNADHEEAQQVARDMATGGRPLSPDAHDTVLARVVEVRDGR